MFWLQLLPYVAGRPSLIVCHAMHGKLYWQTHGSYQVFSNVLCCGQGRRGTYVPGFWSWKGLVSTVLTLMIVIV